MKLISRYQSKFRQSGNVFATIIRFLLTVVLVVVIAALAVGVFKAGYDVVTSLHKSLEIILQHLLIDIVFIIALIEITIIILSYLKDGRVILRYIVDAILIIMVNEVVSLWFRKPTLAQTGSLAIIIVTLVVVRVGVMHIESKSPRPA
jgi:uncharacterized membrane protein (DUF373 family)